MNGNWGQWADSSCSVTCGGGTLNRTRQCNDPSPSNGGLHCELSDGTGNRAMMETKPNQCQTQSCLGKNFDILVLNPLHNKLEQNH